MKYKVLIKIVNGTLKATDKFLHKLMKWSEWLNKAAGNKQGEGK